MTAPENPSVLGLQPRAEEPGVRIAVIADQPLVGESVRRALASRGFASSVVPWPSGNRDVRPAQQLATLRPELVLVMCELEPSSRVRDAQRLVAMSPGQVIVLTSTAQGPLWGAVLESGASVVRPTATTLDEVSLMINNLVEGQMVMNEEVQLDLIRSWQATRSEQDVLVARMRSLTPRERTVLRLLYAGDSVRATADLLGVTEATVRSQVKSMLRKLEVNSQLAAVAAFGWLQYERDHEEVWWRD